MVSARWTGARAAFALAACAVLAGTACHRHQHPQPTLVPGQVVKIDSELLDDFYDEIQDYVRLRHAAVDVVPPLPPDATAQQIATRQKALTAAIVQYRRQAKEGEIFTREIEAAFRRIFKEAFEGPDGTAILEELREGNPNVEGTPKASNPTQEVTRPVRVGVNVVYPDDAPFSSVPSSLLLKIPALPEQVRYRFVGRALILRDTEANVILDYIRDIVPPSAGPR
jgi:hypothetical protein